jgi:hypothetical protein
LSNKASFAAYIDELGLAKLCPKNYGRIEDVEFPVVLKRVDLAGSIGVEFVRSRADLDSLLKTPMFRGHKILMQAFVPGATEYVTHCVCKDGAILWHCTFAWDLGSVTQFGIPVFGATVAVTAPCPALPLPCGDSRPAQILRSMLYELQALAERRNFHLRDQSPAGAVR